MNNLIDRLTVWHRNCHYCSAAIVLEIVYKAPKYMTNPWVIRINIPVPGPIRYKCTVVDGLVRHFCDTICYNNCVFTNE